MNIRGERILIVGDSLSALPTMTTQSKSTFDVTPTTSIASPGGLIAKQFLTNGAQATRINARVGRSALSFVNGESGGLTVLANDVADFRPTKGIVFLGTNDINIGVTPAALARTTTALQQIRNVFTSAGVEVFAIGPPTFFNDKFTTGAAAILKTLQSVFGADHVLDLQPLTTTAWRTSDGIHFTSVGAQDIAPKVAAALAVLGTSSAVLAPSSTSTKILWGIAGVVGFAGATWLALYVAKRAARDPRGFAFAVGRHALRYALKRR